MCKFSARKTKIRTVNASQVRKYCQFFAGKKAKKENFSAFSMLKLGVIIASAEGASEKFKIFYKGTTYAVTISFDCIWQRWRGEKDFIY